MLNKSIRLTKEDALGLREIIKHDPRVEKGPSEAIYYCFKDAATNTPNWPLVAKVKFESDLEDEITQEEYSNIKTFNIEESDFEKVLNSINSQLNLTRPRISYMTRLCILAARMRINKESNMEEKKARVDVEIEQIDGVILISKIAELLCSNSEVAHKKIIEIKQIVEA